MRVGEVVADRFEIQEVAGSGGMGTVHRAHDRVTGTRVAVKVLAKGASHQAARFQREAELLSELVHTSIVRHIAHGTTRDGEPFLAMEWLEGEDLEARLGREGLTVDESIALVGSVAEALAAAHAIGIVHRDVKPTNIFLVRNDVRAPKVLDFGIARRFGAADETASGDGMVGTIGYMAPEQARGEASIDARADVFALGCVLYECLTGRHAFEGSEPIAVLMKLVLEDPPRVRELNRGISQSLDDLVARMLSKEAAQRPARGREIADALALIAAGEEWVAPQSATSQRPRAITRREQRLLAVVLARRALRASGETDADSATIAPGEAHAGPLEQLRACVEPFGARAERLADGSVLAVISGVGHAADLAARAARCALALRDVLPGIPIGLATGRGDDDTRFPAGEVVERVAEIARTASAHGAVRLDEVTAGLLDARFELASDGGAPELIREREQVSITRTLLGKPTPCAGRERELAKLTRVFDECASGAAARVVLVTGEPGIGKSRVRHEFMRRLDERGGPLQKWVGRGDELGHGGAFALLRPSVRAALGIVPSQSASEAREAIRTRVARNVPPALRTRVAVFLGEWVGVPFDAAEDNALATARRDPMVMGDQMRLAWQEFLRAESEVAPVLIVLEDLQWGDLPSISLIDLALRNLRNRRWMVLAVARPEVTQTFPALWEERGRIDVALGPLAPRASERLVRAVLGELAPERTAQIVERAAGSPLYLEELVRAEAEGRGDRVPETVLAMAQARLEALDADARRVLRAASVFGLYFRASGVATLLGGAQTPDEENEHLAKLDSKEWIARVGGDTRADGDAEYAFRQSVVREAAYSMFTDVDRQLGHRLAAEWLAEGDERDAALVAQHFEKGGEAPRAIDWYVRAAEQALDGSDLDAVMARTERAIRCGAAGATLGKIRAIEAEVFAWRAKWAECDARATEASALLPDGSDAWWDNVSEQLRARLVMGHREEAASLAQRVARELESAPSGALVRTAARAAGNLRLCGEADLSDTILERARSTLPTLGMPPPSVLAWIDRADAVRALHAGDLERFAEKMVAAVRHLESAGDVRLACTRRCEAAYSLIELGRHEEAEQTLREALDESERLGLRKVRANALHNLGWALYREGRLDEALAIEQNAALEFAAQGDLRFERASHIYLARIALASGDLVRAENEARRACEQHVTAPTLLAIAPATLGAVLLAMKRPVEALEATREGVALLEAHGADEGECFIRITHALAMDACGDRPGSVAAISKARDRLLERAKSTGGARASFLERIEEHAMTLRLAERI